LRKKSYFATIWKFVLALPPSGPAGFEGLVGACLAHFSGRVFRLARSGFQFGHDGRADPGSEPDVLFECKRYDKTTLDLRELAGEISQAAETFGPHLLWMLVTTRPVDANAAGQIRQAGEQANVSTLLIDALPVHMPRLAVLLAANRPAVEAWLDNYGEEAETALAKASLNAAALRKALAGVVDDPAFSQAVDHLVAAVSDANRGFDPAKQRLVDYHRRLFADRTLAWRDVGQRVAPRDSAVRHVPRPKRIDDLAAAFAEGDAVVMVLGEEGVGKSWLVADWWLTRAADRAIVFIPAKEAVNFLERETADALLAAAIIRAGENKVNETAENLRRRIGFWQKKPPAQGPIVVLDGLNEREVNWRDLLYGVWELVTSLKGRLIITCRPGYYERQELDALDFPKKLVNVSGYDRDEFATALAIHGRTRSNIPPRMLPGLANPRVFTLAIGMLDELGEEELTIDRVLFQYWRHRRSERNLRQTNLDFYNLLISHAKQIKKAGRGRTHVFELDRWKEHSSLAGRVGDATLDHDLDEVAEGRFMERKPSQTREVYSVREEYLPFALGLELVFESLKQLEDQRDVSAAEVLASAIEPVAGFDRTFEVLQGALAIACLHRPSRGDPEATRRAHEVTVAIMEVMLALPNRVEAMRGEFVAFVRDDVAAYLRVAEGQTGRGQGQVDAWLIEALRLGRSGRERGRDRAVAEMIDHQVKRWIVWSPEGARLNPPATDAEQTLVGAFASATFEIRGQPNDLACRIIAGGAFAPLVPAILARMRLQAEIATGAAGRLAWLLLLNSADPEETQRMALDLARQWHAGGVSARGSEAIRSLLHSIATEPAIEYANATGSGHGYRDPRDDDDPDIPPEPDAQPDRLVDALPQTVAEAVDTNDLAVIENVAMLYPSFVALLDRETAMGLTRLLGQAKPAELAKGSLGVAKTFSTSRMSFSLGTPVSREGTGMWDNFRRVEPFALLQSLLAAAAPEGLPALLATLDLPAEHDEWPIAREDCAIPSPRRVETMLSTKPFANDDARTAGLLRLLRRGPSFAPGPLLRETILRLGRRGGRDGAADDIHDAAIDLAAHLPDDPEIDLDAIAPFDRAPGRSFSEVNLFARASSRLGLDAVDRRLGPGGRAFAIQYVPASDLNALLDRFESDLEVLAGIRAMAPNGRQAEKNIEGLSMAAGDRLVTEAPDRLIAWAGFFMTSFDAADIPLSIESIALSLLPPLARVAPLKAATLLGKILNRRFARSFGQERARTLTPSGLAYVVAMECHPAIDEVIEHLIAASPDDAMLAQIVALAAAGGRADRLYAFTRKWAVSGQPAWMARALVIGSGLSTPPPEIEEIFQQKLRGFLGVVAERIGARYDMRRRAEQALAARSETREAAEMIRLECVAIVNATPGEPIGRELGKTANPLERLLSYRLGEAAERRREKQFGKTLFGLSAPPAWLTTASAPPISAVAAAGLVE
jgi:hypothetical protein